MMEQYTVTLEERNGEVGFKIPNRILKKQGLKIGDPVKLFFDRKRILLWLTQ